MVGVKWCIELNSTGIFLVHWAKVLRDGKKFNRAMFSETFIKARNKSLVITLWGVVKKHFGAHKICIIEVPLKYHFLFGE